MDAAVGADGEIEQQGGIAAHGLVVGVHQLGQALHVGVFCLVIEPAGADAGVGFPGAPYVPVLYAIVQHGIGGVSGGGHQAPVGLSHVAGLGAYPAQVSAVSAVVPDDSVGLQFPDHPEGFGPAVIGFPVYPARFVGTAVPAVAAVGAVEPHLKDLPVVGEQLPQLVPEVGHIFRPAVFGVVAVPGGKVHGKTEPFLPAGIGEFLHHIPLPALPGRVLDAVFRIGRRPHAEAAVVLGGKDDALHTGLLANARPLPAVQVFRTK